MTAPDSRYLDEAMARLAEAIAQPVGGSIVISTADACAIGNELRRLQALARGPQQAGGEVASVDALAQLIRAGDGNHRLGAGALAELLWPHYAALQAEVARYKENDRLQMERAIRAEAALREAQANDRRYRWLRDNCVREWESDMPHNKGAPSLDIDFEANGHDLDAAIDAAIAEAGK